MRFREVSERQFDKHVTDLRRLVQNKYNSDLPDDAREPDVQEITTSNGFPTAMVLLTGPANDERLRRTARQIKDDIERNRAIAEREPALKAGGFSLMLFDDQTVPTRHAIGVTETNALIGLPVVLGLCWLFLGSRLALLVSLGIPFSLAGAFAILYAFDFTLSIPVLLGIVIALGMLADDAVVNLDMPSSSAIDVTLREAAKVEAVVRRHLNEGEARGVTSYAGVKRTDTEPLYGESYGQVSVSLNPRGEGMREVGEVVAAMRSEIEALPGPGKLSFTQLSGGPPAAKAISSCGCGATMSMNCAPPRRN